MVIVITVLSLGMILVGCSTGGSSTPESSKSSKPSAPIVSPSPSHEPTETPDLNTLITRAYLDLDKQSKVGYTDFCNLLSNDAYKKFTANHQGETCDSALDSFLSNSNVRYSSFTGEGSKTWAIDQVKTNLPNIQDVQLNQPVLVVAKPHISTVPPTYYVSFQETSVNAVASSYPSFEYVYDGKGWTIASTPETSGNNN